MQQLSDSIELHNLRELQDLQFFFTNLCLYASRNALITDLSWGNNNTTICIRMHRLEFMYNREIFIVKWIFLWVGLVYCLLIVNYDLVVNHFYDR